MATAEERAELVTKLTAFVRASERAVDAAAWRRTFLSYDHDADGRLDADELEQLLGDAGIGNPFTRGAWARGVLDAVDADRDDAISLAELAAAMKVDGAPLLPPDVQPEPMPPTRGKVIELEPVTIYGEVPPSSVPRPRSSSSGLGWALLLVVGGLAAAAASSSKGR